MPRILFFGYQITELAENGFRCSFLYIYKVPLRDVVGLKSRGCRKLKRGSIIIRRPYLPRRVVLCTVLQDEVRRRVFDFQLVRENVIMIACIYRIFR